MLQITPNSPPKEILQNIVKLREQKGKEKEALQVIEKALVHGHDFVINLLWEEALTYQHLVMNEDAKGEEKDREARSQILWKMEETVGKASYLIVRLDLEWWKHRLYRFWGRVYDYKGDYKKAVKYYKKSLKHSKNDPDYLERRYPRWLEVEALLSYSTIMSGQYGKGHTLAEDTYKKFDTDKNALFLKKSDYLTWAIWKTGVPIRTIGALLDRKVIFDKDIAYDWLSGAEKNLIPKEKFDYRIDEIKAVKQRLNNAKD